MEKINLKIITTLFIIFLFGNSKAQSFNDDKVAFSNYLKRMYASSPFEGVKIVDDYDHQYLLSVISLEKSKYSNPSIRNRVAQIKAQSQANTFLNGAEISMEMIITTKETKDNNGKLEIIVETVESIKQNSMGFSKGLELLNNFESSDSKRMVYMYIREMKKESN
jgi:hypothetical protein